MWDGEAACDALSLCEPVEGTGNLDDLKEAGATAR